MLSPHGRDVDEFSWKDFVDQGPDRIIDLLIKKP
jgi:hypothetical protein